MAIPKVNREDILHALHYIDENGIPDKNKSARYSLVDERGQANPPQYVIAVAN